MEKESTPAVVVVGWRVLFHFGQGLLMTEQEEEEEVDDGWWRKGSAGEGPNLGLIYSH